MAPDRSKARSKATAAPSFPIDEDELRGVGRKVRVAVHLPERRRVDQIEMPPDQLGEGVVRAIPCVKAEQFGVVLHGGSMDSTRRARNRTKNWRKAGNGSAVRSHQQ